MCFLSQNEKKRRSRRIRRTKNVVNVSVSLGGLRNSFQNIFNPSYSSTVSKGSEAKIPCNIYRVVMNDGSLNLKKKLFPRRFIQLSIKAVEAATTMHSRITNICERRSFCGTSCSVRLVYLYPTTLFLLATTLCCKHQFDMNIIRCSKPLMIKK